MLKDFHGLLDRPLRQADFTLWLNGCTHKLENFTGVFQTTRSTKTLLRAAAIPDDNLYSSKRLPALTMPVKGGIKVLIQDIPDVKLNPQTL